MSAHENGNRPSIGKITRRGIARHYDEISKAAFVQLLIRVAVVAPLLFCKTMGGRMPDILAAGASLGVYVFILIPMRFWAKQKVRRVYYRHSNTRRKEDASTTYSRWLGTGLLRYLRGILWGLPFIACAVYFIVLRPILPYPTWITPVHWLAMLLAGNPEDGLGNVSLAWELIGGLVALFGLLFAYGWWRDLPFEYLPVRSIGTSNTVRWSRRIRKKHRKSMFGNVCVNFLLSLPAILGFSTVVWLYIMDKVRFTYGVDVIFTDVMRLFQEPVPQMVLLELLGVFAVLYLPFCIWRKCRNAALMARYIRPHAHTMASEAEKIKEAEAPKQEQTDSQEDNPEEETAPDDNK